MSNSRTNRRLDQVESILTPKECAIRLVKEIRRHSDEADFLRTIARGSYRESPILKPFFTLHAQAEARYAGNQRARVREQLSKNLRIEYQALKYLISIANRELEACTERARLRADTLATRLQLLIVQRRFSQAAEAARSWIEQCKAVDYEERQSVLADLTSLKSSLVNLRWLANDWADQAAVLLMEIFAYKAAVEAVQRDYFDQHSIVFPGLERGTAKTTQLLLDLACAFNEMNREINWCGDDSGRSGAVEETPTPSGGPEQIDVNAICERARAFVADALESAWVTEATDKATADILMETNEHEDFVWRRFRERVGLETS